MCQHAYARSQRGRLRGDKENLSPVHHTDDTGSVSSVPNRQNRSGTDEMAPEAPVLRAPGTHGTPKILACDQIWSGGRFAQNGLQDRENPLFRRCWPGLGPGRGREISPSPQDPQKPVNCELQSQEAEPSKVQKVRKLRNANAVLMGQKKSHKLLGGAESRPKQRHAGNIWFNPGLNLGHHPPWAPPPQKKTPSKSRIARKTG